MFQKHFQDFSLQVNLQGHMLSIKVPSKIQVQKVQK